MKFYSLFFIVVSTLSVHLSFSQSEIRLQHFSTRDGLSQNTINFIFQDSRGFIWIGTHDGLNKFDGLNFTVFKNNEDDPNSINSNDNYSVFEDSKGRLWFGTGQGVSLYNRETDNFKNYKYVHEGGYPLRPIWDIVASHDPNKLWLGASGGLFLFDIEKESFKHYVIDESKLGANAAQVLLVDHKKTLWIGTNGGGLYSFDQETETLKGFKHNASDKRSLSDNIIRSIYEDSDNNIWIGTNKGILNKFNYTDSSFYHYPILTNKADGIFDILEDKSRNLWIGTDKEGMFKFDRNNEVFVPLNYKAEPGNNVIRSLYEDLKGNIWIGTYGGGVFLYDYLDNFFHFNLPYQINSNSNKDKSNSVLAIHESPDNSLWLGTDGGGLTRYDRNKNATTYFRKNGNNGLPGNTVLSLHYSKDNTLYIGTFLDGFSIYDIEENRFTNFKNIPLNSQSISDDTVWDIYEEKNGLVWLATNTGGLNLFDPENKTFKQFTYNDTQAEVISTIMKFAADHELDGINIYLNNYSLGDLNAGVIGTFFGEIPASLPEGPGPDGEFFYSVSVPGGWTTGNFSPIATIERIDWINLQPYRNENLTPVDHSSVWAATDLVATWQGFGVPSEKIVVGIPAFGLRYEMPTDGTEVGWGNLWMFATYISYADILAKDPEAHTKNQLDEADGIFYDGHPKIAEKAQFVLDNDLGGLMLWSLESDVRTPGKSLLEAANAGLDNP